MDETKLHFSSEWDTLDKIPDGGFTTTSVAANTDTVIGTYTGNPPMITVQIKPNSETRWYLIGTNPDAAGTLRHSFAWFSSGNIYCRSDTACTARLLKYYGTIY